MRAPIPDSLLRSAARKDLNILVGSGVSVAAGLPSWKELLLALTRSAPARRRQQAVRFIEAGRFLDAAELLVATLGTAQVISVMRDLLDLPQRPTPLHDAIWDTGVSVVLTTNFDRLLETSFARTKGEAATVALGNDPLPDRRTLSPTIIKLHGDIAQPDSIVLARKDYLSLMPQIIFARHSGWSELLRRPTLAVGYSLHDPDLQLLLSWGAHELRALSQPFYLLIPEQAEEEILLLRSVAQQVVPIESPAGVSSGVAALELLRTIKKVIMQAEQPTDQGKLSLLSTSHLEVRSALHDLVNIMTSIVIGADFIAKNPGEKKGEAKELIDRIGAGARQGVRILQEAYDSVTSISERLMPTDWKQVRDHMRNFLSSDRRYSSIRYRIPSAIRYVLPMGARLYSRLVRSLLDNALEATQQVALPVIVLRVKMQRRQRRGQMLETEVSDNGPGISPDIAPRLFEPGTSTKGASRGQGLLLLKEVVEEAGGEVSVRSSPGKGTVVSFALPLRHPEEESSSLDHVPESGSIPGRFDRRLAVVIVEDDPGANALISRILMDSGCDVQAYLAPREAQRSLVQRQRSPDCLIADIVMPHVSGYELATSALTRFPRLGVVLTSGYVFDPILARESAVTFLAKPFTAADLVKAVATVTESRLVDGTKEQDTNDS